MDPSTEMGRGTSQNPDSESSFPWLPAVCSQIATKTLRWGGEHRPQHGPGWDQFDIEVTVPHLPSDPFLCPSAEHLSPQVQELCLSLPAPLVQGCLETLSCQGFVPFPAAKAAGTWKWSLSLRNLDCQQWVISTIIARPQKAKNDTEVSWKIWYRSAPEIPQILPRFLRTLLPLAVTKLEGTISTEIQKNTQTQEYRNIPVASSCCNY